MKFKNAEELLGLCRDLRCPISEIMIRRECSEGETDRETVIRKMERALAIMKHSAHSAIDDPHKSMGGLIGGEARRISEHAADGRSACGALTARGIAYAMGVLEVNAGMGLIVAAPTAGSSGVVPGVLLTLQDEYGFSDAQLVSALFHASAIGCLAMRNATVSGAVGGCQAEVGVASAMAAGAAVELLGGTPEQSLDAACMVLMNMLGLVCDPVGGLVEYPCQNRNAAGVVNALGAAQVALSGVRQLISFDEMLAIMLRVGKSIPAELRETALGGCALSRSACSACAGCASPETDAEQ